MAAGLGSRFYQAIPSDRIGTRSSRASHRDRQQSLQLSPQWSDSSHELFEAECHEYAVEELHIEPRLAFNLYIPIGICQGLRTWNAMLITECLELGIGPRIENPVFDIGPALVGGVFSFVPVRLDMRKQTILVLLGLSRHVVAARLQICAELGSIPFIVRLYNIVIPVLRDEILQILAVSWGWIWDVLVRQPSLKLRLVPLVVDCVT